MAGDSSQHGPRSRPRLVGELPASEEWRRATLTAAAIAGSLAVLAVGVATNRTVALVAPLSVLGALALRRVGRTRISWNTIFTVMLAVIFFIPIKRYALPGSTSFDLEPYRVVVALIIAGWFLSLLADPRVRWSKTILDRPMAMLLTVVLVSELANAHRVAALGSVVIKALTFFLSFLLVYYLLTSTIRTRADVDRIVYLLVGFGTALAVTALFEFKTHINIYNHLHSVFPILRLEPAGLISASDLERNGSLRAYASAQHPIALGALFMLLFPLSVYLARAKSKRWWIASALLVLGTLSTGSRTGILMLLTIGLVYFWLRRQYVKRLWPLLIPALVAVHVALPGALGGLRGAFFPQGGLIKQQSTIVRGNQLRSNGRIADIGPALHQIAGEPLVGLGYGTRITAGPTINAAVLDDEWLGTLEEIGALGMLAWIWLFARSVRRLSRESREDDSDRGWLLVGLAAALTAFAVGMLSYDAFSFIQVTFMVFIFLGLADRALALPRPERRAAV